MMTIKFFLFVSLFLFFSGNIFAADPCGGKYLGHNGSFYKIKPETKDCPQCEKKDEPFGELKSETEDRLSKAYAIPGLCCTDFTIAEGMTCRGKMEPYPEDVLVFIPSKFKPREKTDVILHLHGHYADGLNFEETVPRRFNFPKLLAETGRNSILVVPKSEDTCYTFDTQFIPSNNKKGFTNFMAAVDAKLAHLSLSGKPSIGSMALTGHSGAYRSIDGILQQKKTPWFSKIEKVVMFESTYGPNNDNPKRPGLIDFVKDQGEKFTSVFIDEYDTHYGSEYLEKEYCRKNLGEDASKKELLSCSEALEKNPKSGEPRFLRYSEKSMKGNPFNHEHYQAMIQTFSKLLAP